MNQIETAQYIIDKFKTIEKTVYKVFFSDPFECCIVFTDNTCEIVNGLVASKIKIAAQ